MNHTAVHRSLRTALSPHHGRLLGLLLLFATLTAVYNVTIPLFEAPDEGDHISYAHWLADGNSLPHLVHDQHQVGEIWQPPLYYALLAVLIAPIDRSDMGHIAPLNMDWLEGGFGQLAHYHTEAERFPYRQSSLAVHLARAVSTVLGMVTIVATYGIARLLLPRYALIAAALLALNPQFIFMSAVVNNDNLVIALCSVLLWWTVWQNTRPWLPWWHYLLAGALWGAATLAKLTGLSVGLVLGLGLLLTAVQHKSWRPIFGGIVTASTAVAVAGWWFVRNWQLYGDPLAWQQMLDLTVGLLRPQLFTIPQTLVYATFLRKSYWAMFGYGLMAPEIFYSVMQLIMALACLGLLWHAWQGRRPSWQWGLLLLWAALVLLLLFRWMQQIDTTNQGRLLFPAISSLTLLLTAGLSVFDGRRRWLSHAVILWLGIWAAAFPILLLQPAYAQPAPLTNSTAVPNPTDVQFGAAIQLLGYEAPTAVDPGQTASLTLYWQAMQPISDSYAVAARILDANQRVVSSIDTVPYRGRYPTVVWPAGQPFADAVLLPPVAADATPGLGSFLLILYPLGHPGEPLPVTVHNQPIGHELYVTAVKINPTTSPTATPNHASQARFGDQAILLGFDLTADNPLQLTLYWQAQQPNGRDYTVFAHLLDAQGHVVAQADGPPQQNRYPTSIWAAGEQIIDSHHIQLPEDLPTGSYQLFVGLYDPTTGERLPVTTADGRSLPDGRVPLLPLLDLP